MSDSFIGGLKQEQIQAQKAASYDALMQSMREDSLAKNAVARSRAEYDNTPMGYGLTRADVARAMGRPTSEVSVDTLGDQELQQLGYQKRSNQQNALELMSNRNVPSSADVAPISQDIFGLGLAGQLTGRVGNVAEAKRYVDGLPTPGGVEMNADRYTPSGKFGEVSDIIPRSDEDIRALKSKGAY